MEMIRETVLECLNVASDDDSLIDALNRIARTEGIESYPIILHVLTNLVLTPSEAVACWEEILDHYSDLCSVLNRPVSLRTAICDYFCSIHKSLKNPKVVEINVFEKTVKASRFDGLTGLYNRSAFDESLQREMQRARRHNQDLSILFFDLDDFKTINDTYGHQAGDDVLAAVAEIIQSEKRTEDIAARYGGEEIVIILPQTGKVNTMVLGERIRRRVERFKMPHNGHQVQLTISGGVASYPINATDPTSLLKCADHALYRAKGSGKNNIAFYSEDKRRYLRIDFDKEIKVKKLVFEDTPSHIALGKNIGMGGILFEYHHPIDIDTNVQVKIPVDREKNLFVIGKVIRVEHLRTGTYDIGITISFLEMDKTLKNEISRWLQDKRQETIGAEV